MYHSKGVLQIDLSIIKSNYEKLRTLCDCEVSAVIKANAYGLGIEKIAPMLQGAKCRHFFVANCDEGIMLRKILGQNENINIYVLHGVFYNEVENFTEYNLIPVLNQIQQIKLWQSHSKALNKRLPCCIHIDTGMHRLGIQEDEINIIEPQNTSNLDILYILSHLSSSEEFDNPSNNIQLNKFEKYTSKFSKIKRSLANSSGIFLGSKYHFDLVRSGGALYGVNPAPWLDNAPTKNPINLSVPIIQIHDLPPNNSLGYNGTYVNKNNYSRKIATIAIGYADGFSRSLSNKGYVYINKFKAPIIGRVSMDLVTIDVSNIPDQYISLGTMVEIIGNNLTLSKVATLCSTTVYEILTMLGTRYERVYNR